MVFSYRFSIHMQTFGKMLWVYYSWSIMHFWEGLVWWKEAERKRGGVGVLSYVKQACGCPPLCGVRTLFSGQFEHASVASLALAPLMHYTEPQQKLEYVASSLGAPPPPPPHCSTLNYAPLPLLHTLTWTQAAGSAYSGPLAAVSL